MKVGDLVCFPDESQTPRSGDPLGVITRVKPDGIYRGRNLERVRVFWIKDNAQSWEPRKWLKVMNESH